MDETRSIRTSAVLKALVILAVLSFIAGLICGRYIHVQVSAPEPATDHGNPPATIQSRDMTEQEKLRIMLGIGTCFNPVPEFQYPVYTVPKPKKHEETFL